MVRLNIYNNEWQELPLMEDKPIVEITDQQYIDLLNGKLRVENGKLVDNSQKKYAEQRIQELKTLLNKYKEDVEQVELFGMERTDYEEKKLRELEKKNAV